VRCEVWGVGCGVLCVVFGVWCVVYCVWAYSATQFVRNSTPTVSEVHELKAVGLY
jgi:hypothetical protein